MVLAGSANRVSEQDLTQWQEEGYVIMRGLYSPEQVAALRETFDAMAQKGEPTDFWSPQMDDSDPLKRYPRVIHPHRHESHPAGRCAREMMLLPVVRQVLHELLGRDSYACQSMYYYKPPGARGQALHQDNFYLEIEPDTCYAAWTAIDSVSPENGGLYVVPGSHRLELQCPKQSDLGESFTNHLVSAPKGFKAIPTHMEPGDTLFFNGNVIHGSGANRSKTQWRRSFICHYMPHDSQFASNFYFPVLDCEGRTVEHIEVSSAGGPCGVEGNYWKPSSYDQIPG